MQLRDRDIRGLPVVTKSGQRLGKVASFSIDSGTQAVVQYAVSASGVAALWARTLVVAASSVLSLDNEKMVVADGTMAEESEARILRKAEASIVPTATRSE